MGAIYGGTWNEKGVHNGTEQRRAGRLGGDSQAGTNPVGPGLLQGLVTQDLQSPLYSRDDTLPDVARTSDEQTVYRGHSIMSPSKMALWGVFVSELYWGTLVRLALPLPLTVPLPSSFVLSRLTSNLCNTKLQIYPCP